MTLISKTLNFSKLEHPQILLEQFFMKKSTCMDNYESIKEMSLEYKDDVIYSSYLYQYKPGNMKWLGILVKETFFKELLCFMNQSIIDLPHHRIDFIIRDEKNEIYSIGGFISLEKSQEGYEGHLEIQKFEIFLTCMIPTWIKIKICEHILYRIETDLLYFYSRLK